MGVEWIVAPEAQQDIDEAYAWYEGRQHELGEVFLSRVDACIQAVLRRLEMHAHVFKGYRRALARRLPYAIFYEYADDVVTFYCVLHTSRDPNKWRQRLS